MITFQRETWASYVADAGPLWCEHYDEIATDKPNMPMRPDVALYEAMESLGRLVVLTAREDGALVGYFVGLIHPHPHYADVICGTEDAYFLTARCRRGMTGVRLLKAAETQLRAAGAHLALFHTKARKDLGLIFERLGFEKSDVIYRKRLV